jgi:hypothetical protein
MDNRRDDHLAILEGHMLSRLDLKVDVPFSHEEWEALLRMANQPGLLPGFGFSHIMGDGLAKTIRFDNILEHEEVTGHERQPGEPEVIAVPGSSPGISRRIVKPGPITLRRARSISLRIYNKTAKNEKDRGIPHVPPDRDLSRRPYAPWEEESQPKYLIRFELRLNNPETIRRVCDTNLRRLDHILTQVDLRAVLTSHVKAIVHRFATWESRKRVNIPERHQEDKASSSDPVTMEDGLPVSRLVPMDRLAPKGFFALHTELWDLREPVLKDIRAIKATRKRRRRLPPADQKKVESLSKGLSHLNDKMRKFNYRSYLGGPVLDLENPRVRKVCGTTLFSKFLSGLDPASTQATVPAEASEKSPTAPVLSREALVPSQSVAEPPSSVPHDPTTVPTCHLQQVGVTSGFCPSQ